MIKNELNKYNEKTFEDIKHIDEYGNEFWYARELQMVLDYKKWQKFINVIENAKVACEQSDFIINNHFTQVGKMIINHKITLFTSHFCIFYYIY